MIGIFDSGCGGLTVMRAVRDQLPSSDVLYFGDTKNAPYGSRSREEISLLTVQAIKFLQNEGAESLVSACNSVSASLAVSLFDAFSIAPQSLIEMVGPTVAYFRNSTVRILLCATSATIDSGVYQNAFQMVGQAIQTMAIPALAGAIESGASLEEIEEIITHVFADTSREDFDVLLLACTHYPLVIELFQKVLGPSKVVFDPAFIVADRARRQFWPREVGDSNTRFVISEDSDVFRGFVEKLFPDTTYEIEVLE
jgi:glutamate racemase